MTTRRGVPAAILAPRHSTMKAPPAGAVPNPRQPRVVRDVHGTELMDLFVFFPDLPRPARTRTRLPARRILRRLF